MRWLRHENDLSHFSLLAAKYFSESNAQNNKFHGM